MGHEVLGKHVRAVTDWAALRAGRMRIGGARVFHGGARGAAHARSRAPRWETRLSRGFP